MNISDEAVETAARALRDAFDRGEGGFDELAREALKAAAPYMLAEAWNDGHNAGVDHADGLFGGDNPYGSQG